MHQPPQFDIGHSEKFPPQAIHVLQNKTFPFQLIRPPNLVALAGELDQNLMQHTDLSTDSISIATYDF